jgi:hypothetical protein
LSSAACFLLSTAAVGGAAPVSTSLAMAFSSVGVALWMFAALAS